MDNPRLLAILRGAPRLLEVCKELGTLHELRSACSESRLLATAEITRLVVDCEQPDISFGLRQLQPLLTFCKLRCLEIALHEDYYGEAQVFNKFASNVMEIHLGLVYNNVGCTGVKLN